MQPLWFCRSPCKAKRALPSQGDIAELHPGPPSPLPLPQHAQIASGVC